MRIHALLVPTFLLAVATAAAPDSWMPYGKKRVPDPTGRFYVVLDDVNYGIGGVTFAFVAAKAGTDPVTRQDTEAFKDPPKDFGVREGDTVLSTGKLTTAPLEVRVSSLGNGFAAMEEHGGVGGGDSFVWVTREGVVKHVRRMAELFTREEIEQFTHTVSSIWWFRAGWIDEEAREVVVVGNGGLVRAVSIDTGKVRKGGDAEIRRGIALPDPDACVPALDLAIERKLTGLEEELRGLFANAKAPLGARLRAAVALAASGDRRGKDLVRATAAKPRPADVAKEDREYAVEHLADLLGDEAIPLLRAAMRGPADEAWHAAQQGFVRLGARAVPVLVEMLAEAKESNDYRGGAAYALGGIGSKDGVPALVAAVADPQGYVANAALNAAIGIAKEEIAKDLAEILDRKTTQDGRLASYFGEVKEPASVEPLVRALERHPEDDYPHDTIVEALTFQTGQSFGGDLAAWKAWLAKQGGR